MAELFNVHTAPVIVTDAATGQRITIQNGFSALVTGDFREHLLVKSGLIRAEHDESDIATTHQESDIATLRQEYEQVLGKKAPSAAKAETLKKAIEDELAEKKAGEHRDAADTSGNE